MSFFKKIRIAVVITALICVVPLSAYDPPKGGFFLPSLYSPWGLAYSPTVTGPSAPWAALSNPSVLADNQLIQFEGAYTGITDFGKAGQGWGSAASLSFSLPAPYGVWGGAARFFSSPSSMTSMPLGTFGGLTAFFAKDILSSLYLGTAVDLTMGGQGGFGWGLSLDLGATWLAGDLGVFKDTCFGLSLLDMGKGYSTPGAAGMLGGVASSYPSSFTLGLGARSNLIQTYYWNLDAGVDVWSPSFQDLGLDLSIGVSFREMVELRLGWSAGLVDILNGTGRSYLPSLGVFGTISLDKGFRFGGQSNRDASLGIGTAFAPLYDSLYALSAGASLSFGLRDRTAPVIKAELPAPYRGTVYISPDGDGRQDSLDIPISISDERYVTGWKLTVEDQSAGKVVRTIGESNDRVEAIRGFDSLGSALTYSRKSVAVPSSLSWDGKDDSGLKVPDGSYTLSLRAWDDNGNQNLDYLSCLTVVVDSTKPQASARSLEPTMILSPDGDRKKDTIAFRNTGSVENGWKIELFDGVGNLVRSREYSGRSAPADFEWDGTANDGSRVPDGSYSLRLSTRDEAGNLALSEVKNIIVDTRRPQVSIATDGVVMSPNGDGISDSLLIAPSFESFENLSSWEVAVHNPEKTKVWRVWGGADNPPEKSYTFTGFSEAGQAFADGQYEALVTFEYKNGYGDTKFSAPFYMDRTPPSASIRLADKNTIFSPDGDGSRDGFIFTFDSSEEDTWNLIIRDSHKNEKVVRRYSQNLPESLEWNGKDDQGRLVEDGNYEVYVFSVDRAGNSFATSSAPVQLDTRRPGSSLKLDREAFSPNSDGIAESLLVSPQIETLEGLVAWKFSISSLGEASREALAYTGETGELPAARYTFEGKGADGRSLPEGKYRARLELSYINGFSSTVESQDIVLDRTYPSATAKAEKKAFNPAGNPDQSTFVIEQDGSAEKLWKAAVMDSKGQKVKSWEFSGKPSNIAWDGVGDSGFPVPDGSYRYLIAATDESGNSFASKELPFEVDTRKKELRLAADSLAFSPNGDGVKDSLDFSAEATDASRLDAWRMWIVAGSLSGDTRAARPVKSWQGGAVLPKNFEWNGQSDVGVAVPDGQYSALLSLSYPNGDKAETVVGPFTVDRVPPRATVSLSTKLFSPNGDGILDTVTITQEAATALDRWEASIFNAGGEQLKNWTWDDKLETLVWDGRDSSQAILADGTYYYELKSTDVGGNSYSSGRLPVAVETEKKAVRLDIDQRAFSPNGDGQRDELGIGIIIQAPERVKDYELIIVAQDGPMAMSAVRSWKGTGAAPQRIIWRGESDSGVQAPDGRYAASIRVNYFNGDQIEAPTPGFLVDRIAPRIDVSASLDIISPNGDGRSDSVDIRQNSLKGDDWKASIKAADGRLVKSYSWKDEVAGFTWDGRDETGALVRDGRYRYQAEAVDLAGNRTLSKELSIAVETEKKTVRLDADALAFSPNGDGKRDRLLLGLRVQYPERVKSFELTIVQAAGGDSSLPVKSWKGSSDVRSQYYWDGFTDSGIPAPDGSYYAKLTLLYANDDLYQQEIGPLLVDRIAPQATLRASAAVFSPNGDGRSDTVEILQEALPGDVWQGQITDSGSRIVRSWTWEKGLSSLVWDGKNQSGNLVPDGQYYYELRSIDQADNSFVSSKLPLEVDATGKTVRLDVDQKAFSPNGDGVKDALYINILAPKAQTIADYEISVFALDAAGARQSTPVRIWSGQADLRDQYTWDGKTESGIMAPDGEYQVTARIHYRNDDLFELASPRILVDRVAPKISASGAPLLFSPNGDGNKDTITISQNSSLGDDWTGRMRTAAGLVVRSWSWKNEARSFVWDGKDSSGKVVPDGVYSYEVGASDAAGNAASAKVSGIRVDASTAKVYVTASDTGMSPNNDGIRDEVSFTIVVERREGIESWRFSLLDTEGVERSYFGSAGSDVPARLVWDGRDLQGQVVQGEYVGKLVVNYEKGDVAQATSTPVLVDVDPPAVSINVRPEYFSPDDDGVDDKLSFDIQVDAAAGVVDWKLEVFETAIVESSNPNAVSSERLFKDWSGKGKPPASIAWDGKSSRGELVESATDYRFSFVARDQLGNSTTVSGIIAVDVLVIRDGDRLKIKVPSIVFRANYADFVGLSADIVARNEQVVARIAQILNKFPDYRVRIEGHANNVAKMLGYSQSRIQTEETKELIPLSTGRAELVRTMLVGNGVDARRLSVEGLGSSEPVVSFFDVENRWKNRRVEFVLIKNQ
jgi:flagellar hook assembly protein FlgD/outer membrane protein OmpA-like peptidoglycan-associated protein